MSRKTGTTPSAADSIQTQITALAEQMVVVTSSLGASLDENISQSDAKKALKKLTESFNALVESYNNLKSDEKNSLKSQLFKFNTTSKNFDAVCKEVSEFIDQKEKLLQPLEMKDYPYQGSSRDQEDQETGWWSTPPLGEAVSPQPTTAASSNQRGSDVDPLETNSEWNRLQKNTGQGGSAQQPPVAITTATQPVTSPQPTPAAQNQFQQPAARPIEQNAHTPEELAPRAEPSVPLNRMTTLLNALKQYPEFTFSIESSAPAPKRHSALANATDAATSPVTLTNPESQASGKSGQWQVNWSSGSEKNKFIILDESGTPHKIKVDTQSTNSIEAGVLLAKAAGWPSVQIYDSMPEEKRKEVEAACKTHGIAYNSTPISAPTTGSAKPADDGEGEASAPGIRP